MKRIGPIDQNLVVPLGKTCKCLGHVVPGHSKKDHFASCCLFLGGSRCSRTKLINNFSQAVGAAAIAKLYLMAGLQCPLCERLCESSCSNGSDFHTLSFLMWAFQHLESTHYGKRTKAFPKFSPLSMPMKAFGAFSSSSIICSR